MEICETKSNLLTCKYYYYHIRTSFLTLKLSIDLHSKRDKISVCYYSLHFRPAIEQ